MTGRVFGCPCPCGLTFIAFGADRVADIDARVAVTTEREVALPNGFRLRLPPIALVLHGLDREDRS